MPCELGLLDRYHCGLMLLCHIRLDKNACHWPWAGDLMRVDRLGSATTTNDVCLVNKSPRCVEEKAIIEGPFPDSFERSAKSVVATVMHIGRQVS